MNDIRKIMSFGEVFSIATDICRNNSKAFIRTMLVYTGPFYLFSAISQIILMFDQFDNYLDGQRSSPFDNIFSTIVILIATIFSFIIAFRFVDGEINNTNNDQPPGKILQNISFIKRLRLGGFFIIFNGIIYGSMMMYQYMISERILSGAGIFFVFLILMVLLFYISSSMSTTPFVILNENKRVFASIDRNFTLSKKHRWFTFGIIVVNGLIMLLLIFGILATGGLVISLLSISGFHDVQVLLKIFFISYILLQNGIIMIYSGIMAVILNIQYLNLKERNDLTSIEQKLKNIGSDE